jgi:hypothetical protein
MQIKKNIKNAKDFWNMFHMFYYAYTYTHATRFARLLNASRYTRTQLAPSYKERKKDAHRPHHQT